jgi:hypothetical protein
MQEAPGDAYVSNSTPLPDGLKAQQSAADGTAVYASQVSRVMIPEVPLKKVAFSLKKFGVWILRRRFCVL